MHDGYIKLYRTFFSHEFWLEKREYSYAEAWMDLIQQARWKEGTGVVLVKKRPVEISRGQLVASVRFLQHRWSWASVGKVLRFFEMLKKRNMIEIENGTGISVITVCEYDVYNKEQETDGTATEQKTEQQRNSNGTATEQQRNKEERKKEKKESKTGNNYVVETGTDAWVNQLKADEIFREQVARSHMITGEGFDILLNTFTGLKIALGEDKHRNYSDFRRNFFFWIPKHLESKKYKNDNNHLHNGHLATEQTVRTVFEQLLQDGRRTE
jgi:hypothetical protein